MPSVGTPVGLPAQVDLRIRQGSDVTWALTYRETDPDGTTRPNTFVGWSARAQVRKRVGGEVWHAMTSGPDITLTTVDDKLTLTGRIAHSVTENTGWDDRDFGCWDVELVRADGTVIPLAAGQVYIEHDVTRDA